MNLEKKSSWVQLLSKRLEAGGLLARGFGIMGHPVHPQVCMLAAPLLEPEVRISASKFPGKTHLITSSRFQHIHPLSILQLFPSRLFGPQAGERVFLYNKLMKRKLCTSRSSIDLSLHLCPTSGVFKEIIDSLEQLGGPWRFFFFGGKDLGDLLKIL